MAKRLSAEEKRLRRDIKTYNVRLATLYKEAQKAGNMSAYDKYTAILQNALGRTALVHTTSYGALQLSQSPRKYQRRDMYLVRLASRVPTLTEIKNEAKKIIGEDAEVTVSQALDTVAKAQELQDAFDTAYRDAQDSYTDAEMSDNFDYLYEKGKKTYEHWNEIATKFVDEIKKEKGTRVPLVSN